MTHVMGKPDLCIYAKTKLQISCAVTEQLIIAFVFTTQIVQFLYFLNPRFQASNQLSGCAVRFEEQFPHLEAQRILGFLLRKFAPPPSNTHKHL